MNLFNKGFRRTGKNNKAVVGETHKLSENIDVVAELVSMTKGAAAP